MPSVDGLITSAGIGERSFRQRSRERTSSPLLEPGLCETDCGRMTSRACTNSAASVAGNITPGESWPKASRGFAWSMESRSGLTSTSRVGDRNPDRVRISEPLTPSFRVVSIRDELNFSGPSNSIRLETDTDAGSATRNVSVSTGWGFYLARKARQDGFVRNSLGNLIVPSNGSTRGTTKGVGRLWKLHGRRIRTFPCTSTTFLCVQRAV